jgi:hypothetical protein
MSVIDTREHDPLNCDCNSCYPTAHPEAPAEVCNCIDDGLRASLVIWQEKCSCCFSEAFPEGIEGALRKAHAH